MEIKLWHLALPGFVIPFLYLLLLPTSGREVAMGAVAGASSGIITVLSLIPLRLLYFEKTRKAGAVVSIIYGILYLWLITWTVSESTNILILIFLSIPLLIGVSYLLAGVWYLWKKESVIVIK